MQPDEMQDETLAERPEPNPLDPAHIRVLRVRIGIFAAFLVLIAWLFDLGPLRETPVPPLLVPGLVLFAALAFLILYPPRRYGSWGYWEGEDEIEIKRGNLFRVRTIVPFGRVQHIDVAQGPIQRGVGLATLTLHTAGTQSASVSLPGLTQSDAEAMRDRIRAKIRQDLV